MNHDHAPHGPIVHPPDENGNVMIDYHGWGHPLDPVKTPLLDLLRENCTSPGIPLSGGEMFSARTHTRDACVREGRKSGPDQRRSE